ncbi:hypothetical protein PS639_05352 [Pseudomonas fluorescens]|nr:hypothetical protein PS639_05352 [Pseudomonas fluorescens]
MTDIQQLVPLVPKPPIRRLRVYAFDPQSSVELKTAVINDTVIELSWEPRWEEWSCGMLLYAPTSIPS